MAHELQPVMPTAVPGLPLKLTDSDLELCILDLMDFGLTQHVERLRYRWPRVAARESCGDRSSKQSLNGQVGVLPERRWTNPKGVTNQTKNVPASEVLHFFLPTKIQQKWPNFWHPEVMLVRDTHLLFATLGSAPNNMLECSETKRPQNACFLYFLVMKQLASVS